jgi:hypothetical protein
MKCIESYSIWNVVINRTYCKGSEMADRLTAMGTTTNENHLRKASAALSPPSGTSWNEKDKR